MSVIGVVLAGVSLGTTWADASPTAGRLVPRSRSSTAPAPSRPWRSSFSFATSSRCSCRAGAYGRPGSLADDRPFLCAVDVHGCGDADTHGLSLRSIAEGGRVVEAARDGRGGAVRLRARRYLRRRRGPVPPYGLVNSTTSSRST